MVVSALLHAKLHNMELYVLLLTKYNSGDQIKKAEMGRACSTHGEEERYIQGFGREA